MFWMLSKQVEWYRILEMVLKWSWFDERKNSDSSKFHLCMYNTCIIKNWSKHNKHNYYDNVLVSCTYVI